jgi:menaquinone-dependent protoporphyrinogen oxidase
MTVLVSAASRHGATAEIAEAVGRVLTEHGVAAEVLPIDDVTSVDRYEAVVLGSAVYMGHWLEPARRLVMSQASALARRPVWLFSSGPVGDPPKPDEEPVDVATLVAASVSDPDARAIACGRNPTMSS